MMTEKEKTEQLVKIAFKKGGIYVPNKGTLKDAADPAVTQFSHEMLHLGYILPEEAVLTMDEEYVKTFGIVLLNHINSFLGRGEIWKPFYKNFPKDIIDLTESEMLFNQMKHYLNGWEPEENPEEFVENPIDKSQFNDFNCGYELKCMNEEDVMEIFKGALEMNQSLTQDDIKSLDWILKDLGRTDIIPNDIPFKETLAVVISIIWEKAIPYCSSINDILRGIMYSLGMPITFEIPQKFVKNGWGKKISNEVEVNKYKFPNIPRAQRKRILYLIETYLKSENKKLSKDDLSKRKDHWIKLGEKLHPGDYCYEYGLSYELFRLVRQCKFITYGRRLSDAYKESQESVLEVLSERPGEFVRRFDSVYRREDFDKAKTLTSFAYMKNPPSTKVILEFMDHISKRTEEYPRMIEKPDKRSYFTLPTLPPLDEKDVKVIWEYAGLLVFENYTKQSSLSGKTVVIGDNINDIRLPKNMRSVTESLNVVSRGTAFDISKDIDYIRAFAYWKDEKGNMDLDLYGTFVSEDFKIFCNIGWNQSLKETFAFHSGDVRNRVGNCAEFIDININEAVESGYRYLCLDVHDYTGQGFCNFENKFGLVEITRKDIKGMDLNWTPGNGIIQAFKSNSKSSSIIVLIIDLFEKKVYNVDIDLNNRIPVGNYSVGSKMNILKSVVLAPIVSIEDLIKMNTSARGGKIITESQYAEIEEPVEDDYIFYRKEDILKDYTILKDLIN